MHAGVWETHTVPFSSFAPIFRAKTVPDAPALQLEHVNSVQLMLSKFEADGALNPAFKTGSFRLAVSSIAATGRTVSLARGAWAGVLGLGWGGVEKIGDQGVLFLQLPWGRGEAPGPGPCQRP